jgi:predicted DNA-binding protein
MELISFHCNIGKEQKKKLDKLKEKTKIPVATHVRDALELYFKTNYNHMFSDRKKNKGK